MLHLLQREEGAVLSLVVSRRDDAVLWVWYKVMTGIYPVQVYLHRIVVTKSSQCPHYSNTAIETLTHFACVCPAFREARTAAHNQVRAVLAITLKDAVSKDWEVFEETPLAATRLNMQQVLLEEVQQALQDSNNTEADLGNVRGGLPQQETEILSCPISLTPAGPLA